MSGLTYVRHLTYPSPIIFFAFGLPRRAYTSLHWKARPFHQVDYHLPLRPLEPISLVTSGKGTLLVACL